MSSCSAVSKNSNVLSLSYREYLGRQLQSSDQQQAPAVAARSWALPVHVCVCVSLCGWVCTLVFTILIIISCSFCVMTREIKRRGFLFPSALPIDPRCSLIWVSCPRVVPLQLSDVWWLKSHFTSVIMYKTESYLSLTSSTLYVNQ